jgi:MOSC domain-containing protein YiiM
MSESESVVKKLTSTLPQLGRVEWIGLAAKRRAPITAVESVEVLTGKGLVGDHHGKSGRSKRQVTIIALEHLEAIGRFLGLPPIKPERLRRNIVVSGINPIALKGQTFQIGDVLLEGTKACDPCSRMEDELGPGGYNAMRGHGGVCAIVLEGGKIAVGDVIRKID